MQKALQELSDRFELAGGQQDDAGDFESITLLAPDDHAAIDISFEVGEEVLEQGASLSTELTGAACDENERAQLKRLPKLDARFDVLHFEHTSENDAPEDPDEMLDPTALLLVLETLKDLTKGVAVDPQSGSLV
jgi:hypothetical protein